MPSHGNGRRPLALHRPTGRMGKTMLESCRRQAASILLQFPMDLPQPEDRRKAQGYDSRDLKPPEAWCISPG